MKLVYDVGSVPKELGVANMIKIFEQHRVVFWDSNLGVKPAFYADDGVTSKDVTIVDTSGAEVDFDQYEREFNDKVFWDKEIFNCKNSPIYYFTNYGTTKYPASNEDTKQYLESIGLKDITIADSSKAKKAWDKQKDVVRKAMEDITMDHLKNRKAVLDVLKAKYESRILDLEVKLKEDIDLFDSKGEPLAMRKRASNIVGKIKFWLSTPPEEYKTYRNKKRKWDTPMLLNTNYDELLKMAYEIREVKFRRSNKVLG